MRKDNGRSSPARPSYTASADPLPGGVIGSTPDSGSGSWGSSPCPAALTVVTIAERFNGPPGTGNGGYVCGLVAAEIGPAAQVSLYLPPPLGVPLELLHTRPGPVRLLEGDAVVAEGRPADVNIDVPAPPSYEEAAAARFELDHPFPGCFVCGPDHPDGLHILPGPVGSQLACTWRPGPHTDPVYVWAALDCPSGFACMPPGSASVLASMTARLDAPVEADGEYVVSAWKITSDARKHWGGSAIHDRSGALIACAEALWITPRPRG